MIGSSSRHSWLRLAPILLCLAMLNACSTMGLNRHIDATLNSPEMTGTRWGLVVMDLTGKELIAIRPDERFAPASNTKLVTTAAAFGFLPQINQPSVRAGTSLWLVENETGAPDLILRGGGDAMLSDAPDCIEHCLYQLADLLLENNITSINNIIGDDRLFPDERHAPGWSWEDLQYYYGTAISALVVDDNSLALEIMSDPESDQIQLRWEDGDAIFPVVNQATITPESFDDGRKRVRMSRKGGSNSLRVYGSLPKGTQSYVQNIGIEDPALTAAQKLIPHLISRKISVTGGPRALHRELVLADEPEHRCCGVPLIPQPEGAYIGMLSAPPMLDSLTVINKDSNNLHAEVALRRLGLVEGAGSREDGVLKMQQILSQAGASKSAYDFTDGSGLSVYNRISPRAMAKLVLYTEKQSWGTQWRETLPIGGVDGSLEKRFKDTILEGKITAKTGTLTGVNALSGFLETARGKTLVFSFFANDRPSDAPSARKKIDAVLVDIAQRY